MPRSFIDNEPKVINSIRTLDTRGLKILLLATSNQNKIKEFQRLLPQYEIHGVELNVDEVQSLNHLEVAKKKAYEAWRKNKYNPILVEDTSLEMAGLNGRPGTLTDSFTKEPQMRKQISEKWLSGQDRRALARVTIAIYDGKEYYVFEGATSGTIAQSPRGSTEFGWDDIFVPDGQPRGQNKTFAQMKPQEKDKYSMRTKAIKALTKAKLPNTCNVLELPEPFHSELERVREDQILNFPQAKSAIKFAHSLECIETVKNPKSFDNFKLKQINEERNTYFLRYTFDKNSASLGLILTDVDRDETKRYDNGNPILWQMGPGRIGLALAQRSEYFLKNTSLDVLKIIKELDKNISSFPHRSNRSSSAVENLLHGFATNPETIYARAIKELGYKKIYSPKKVSRSKISDTGLFNKVGKYPRIVLGIGSMPAVSGWHDVVLTAILGHMPIFVTRNSIFAGHVETQIKLVNQVKKSLKLLGIKDKDLDIFTRNIGVAIGTSDPRTELENCRKMLKEGGIRLFRIYTINGDPRCIETAKLIRKEFGHEVEIFAGQVTDKTQAEKYLDQAEVDALVFGHGGGRQCTSAANGMAISTVEEIYSMVRDSKFNKVTLIAEGGVGTNVGPLLILGVDAILYNQQLVRGTVETGGLFLQNAQGEYVQPYHGSASAPTMIIEAANPKLRNVRINLSGRTKVPEGKPGYMKYSAKANSMTFWVEEFKYHSARTLADLGVENISEMRDFLLKTNRDLLRIVSTEAAQAASAYGTIK